MRERFTLFGISIFFRMKGDDFLLTGRVNGITTMFERSFIGGIYVHPIISLHRLNEIYFFYNLQQNIMNRWPK